MTANSLRIIMTAMTDQPTPQGTKPRWRLLFDSPDQSTYRPDLPDKPVVVAVDYQGGLDHYEAAVYVITPRLMHQYLYRLIQPNPYRSNPRKVNTKLTRR